VKQNKRLTIGELVDLIEARLTPEEQESLRHRLVTDPESTAELALLERVIDLMRTDDSVDPPPAVMIRALQLFERRARRSQFTLIQRIIATLQFDSMQMPLAYGTRSRHFSARQLLFSADPYDIDLRITSHGDTWSLEGQVLGPCTGGQARLTNTLLRIETPLNDLCEFVLPRVPTGAYRLELQLGTTVIEAHQVEVGG
jgi:anti-sigma factor RsiW